MSKSSFLLILLTLFTLVSSSMADSKTPPTRDAISMQTESWRMFSATQQKVRRTENIQKSERELLQTGYCEYSTWQWDALEVLAKSYARGEPLSPINQSRLLFAQLVTKGHGEIPFGPNNAGLKRVMRMPTIKIDMSAFPKTNSVDNNMAAFELSNRNAIDSVS
ncbi:MAG: hypothetical protein ACI9HK_005860, partial [Pirellulaceae bacterium]